MTKPIECSGLRGAVPVQKKTLHFFAASERRGAAGLLYATTIVPVIMMIFLPIEYGSMMSDARIVRTAQMSGALAAHQEIVTARASAHLQGVDPENSTPAIIQSAMNRGELYAALNIALGAPGRGYFNSLTILEPADNLCAEARFTGRFFSSVSNAIDLTAGPNAETVAFAGEYAQPPQVRETCAGHTKSAFFRQNQFPAGVITGTVGQTPLLMTAPTGSATVVDTLIDFDRNGLAARHLATNAGASELARFTVSGTSPLTVHTAHVAVLVPSDSTFSEIRYSASGTIASSSHAVADPTIRDRWQLLTITFVTSEAAVQSVDLRLNATSAANNQDLFSDAWGYFVRP